MSRLARVIRDEMERQELGLRSLSVRSGLPEVAISRMRREHGGRRRFSLYTLENVAEALGLGVNFLVVAMNDDEGDCNACECLRGRDDGPSGGL